MEDIDCGERIEEYTNQLLSEFETTPKISLNYKIKTEPAKNKKKCPSTLITEPIIITSLNNKKSKNIIKEKELQKIKGNLYKYINPSYLKGSLGSIPNKSEKILLTDKIISDRFSGVNSIFSQNEETPGVGSYNLNYNWKIKNKSVKMDSEEKRFSHNYNFLPGVGEYNLGIGKAFQEGKDNLRYNSLYSKTKTILNINNNSNNNILTYDPKILNDIMKYKKNYNFNSYSGRNSYRGSKIPTFFDKQNDQPGPGQYFQNSNDFVKKKYSYYNLRNKNNIGKKNTKSIKNIFNEFVNNIKIKEDKPSFIMKQNGNKRENKVYNLEDIHNLNNSLKEIIVDKSKELEKKLRENEKTFTSNNLYFKINEKKELAYIKKILGNENGRPDLFYLSPERWKSKKNVFKTPGPAYYFY